MKMRFVAHWFLGGSNQDSVRAESLDDLKKFVEARKEETRQSAGGKSICVADRLSKAENTWLWKMEAGGRVICNTRSKYGKQAMALFGN